MISDHNAGLIGFALARIEAKLDTIHKMLQVVPVVENQPLMTVAEAAQEYKLAKKTLYKLRQVQVKIGPKSIRISRAAMDKYCERLG